MQICHLESITIKMASKIVKTNCSRRFFVVFFFELNKNCELKLKHTWKPNSFFWRKNPMDVYVISHYVIGRDKMLLIKPTVSAFRGMMAATYILVSLCHPHGPSFQSWKTVLVSWMRICSVTSETRYAQTPHLQKLAWCVVGNFLPDLCHLQDHSVLFWNFHSNCSAVEHLNQRYSSPCLICLMSFAMECCSWRNLAFSMYRSFQTEQKSVQCLMMLMTRSCSYDYMLPLLVLFFPSPRDLGWWMRRNVSHVFWI